MIVNNRKKLLNIPQDKFCINPQYIQNSGINHQNFNQRLVGKQLRERDSNSCSLYKQWKQSRNNQTILGDRSIKLCRTQGKYKYDINEQDQGLGEERDLISKRLITQQIKINPFNFVGDKVQLLKRAISPSQKLRDRGKYFVSTTQGLEEVVGGPNISNPQLEVKNTSEKSIPSSNRSIFDKLQVKLKQFKKPADKKIGANVEQSMKPTPLENQQVKRSFLKAGGQVNKHVRWKSHGNDPKYEIPTATDFSRSQSKQIGEEQEVFDKPKIQKEESIHIHIQSYKEDKRVSQTGRIIVSQQEKQKFWDKFRKSFSKNQKQFGQSLKGGRNWRQSSVQKQIKLCKKEQITKHEINRLVNSNQYQTKLRSQVINKIYSQIDKNTYK